MNKKTVSLILKILQIVISILLCVGATVSMLGATLINVARDYLQSEEFHSQVDTTDLSTVQFLLNGKKITVSEYVRETVADYLEDKMPSFFPFQNYAVDAVVSSELVDSVVKTEVYNLVDYFLNTSVEDAEYRIENNITIDENEDLNFENAETVEEAISIYARKFVLQSIENAAGRSTDDIIILMSKETVSKLIIIAVVLLAALVVINLRTVFNILLYGGGISFLYGIVIKVAQSKFDKANEGMEDLVGYVFLKPLADTYSSNAVIGFVVSVILIAMFVGVYFLFKNVINKKTEEN